MRLSSHFWFVFTGFASQAQVKTTAAPNNADRPKLVVGIA